ncbi:hypothetical protein [Enhydrobacter sp.]|uniref:hypothetical protein n=1 Tax=Enhydrobacter sp. TaxID=1894999 RepID=UPI00261A0FD9|nr:hypothetical protein [Enhydrobacter sp.]WIM12967.1 MAG: hypothetical protein OJF58_003931 [Enhydrobacter sp.]
MIVNFTIEDETGARTVINVDPTSFANSGAVTRGWLTRGLQTLLRAGNTVSLQLALCGVAGRVVFLEAASRGPGVGKGQGHSTEEAKSLPRTSSSSIPRGGAPQDDCDTLAANPTDAQRYPGAPGVQFKELHANLDAAIKACAAAADAHPAELRFKYQLARALQYRDKKAAAALFQQLVVAHYAAAFDNLGWIYISDSKDYPRAIQLFQAGYALGDADCAASLFTMIDEKRLDVPNPNQMRLQLLEKAAAANHAGALAALPIERARQGIVANGAAKTPSSPSDQSPAPTTLPSPKQAKADVCAKVPFDSSYAKYDIFVDTIGKKVFLTTDRIDYFLSQVCRAKHGELDRSALINVGLTDQQIDAADDSIDLAATFMIKLHHILQ